MSKILIVEDDIFLQGLEAGKLKKSGFDIAAARNGAEAIAQINDPTINLILLDLILPDFDGFEVLEKIQQNTSGKHVPVIVFSNLSSDKDVERAKKLGAMDFMVKSNFTLDELIEHIHAILK
jgi:DNA-binding response OmpR family regulator